MSYNALDIANAIIAYCGKIDVDVENLRLQKLLYLAWIEYYKETGKFLFSERFEAWCLGPVVSYVYNLFSYYASQPIKPNFTNDSCLDDLDDDPFDAVVTTVQNYGRMSLAKLTDFVRRAGSPWDKVFDGGKGKNEKIPYSLIIEIECNNSLKRNTRWLFTFETGEDWRPGSYGCNEECPFRTAVRFENDECIYTAKTCPLKNHIKKQSSLDAESKDE